LITALDHFVLICPDLVAGADAYQRLLGRAPDWTSEAQEGAATALFKLDNTAIELMAPVDDGPVGARLQEILDASGPSLTSLAFASDSLEADQNLFARRGLHPTDIESGESTDTSSGAKRAWQRFRCPDRTCAGIKTFILQHSSGTLPQVNAGPGVARGLDHIVIATPNPDRAAAHYGARLGLDFRLDRTAEQWKTRFLFFRTGGLTFEVIHRLGTEHDPSENDAIWGLTWAVDDLDAAHARITSAGLNLSEIRQGRKPGSRVFTVRDGTLGVPTLFIDHEPR